MGDRFAQARIKRGIGLFGRQVFGPDMRNRARQFAQFAKLLRGHRVLVRAAPPDDMDVLHLRHAKHRKRSEEHTSELQSLMRISYAVFCLKKKNKENYRNTSKS